MIRARVEGEVAVLLGAEASTGALVAAAAHAHAALDDEGARALARSRLRPPACSAGCSFCCHVHVDATVPEILAVADHLARTRPPGALVALRERLERHVRRVEPLSEQARWVEKIPCALLGDDGRCTVYEARPLRCRAFHACSVEPCRDAFSGRAETEPVSNPTLERAHDAVEEGYDRALAGAGLRAEGHHLEIGLLIALEEPGAGARWLAGEPVFARACHGRTQT